MQCPHLALQPAVILKHIAQAPVDMHCALTGFEKSLMTLRAHAGPLANRVGKV